MTKLERPEMKGASYIQDHSDERRRHTLAPHQVSSGKEMSKAAQHECQTYDDRRMSRLYVFWENDASGFDPVTTWQREQSRVPDSHAVCL